MFPIQTIRLEILDSCESTNKTILDRPTGCHSLLLVARKQTNGVGRRGRTWFSPAGNLSCTLALELRHSQHAFLLPWIPFWLGVSLFETVKIYLPIEAQKSLSLKWPNDLYWNGKKMAGMLAQVRQQGESIRVAAGLGLNMLTIPAENIFQEATSLAEAMGKTPPSLEEFVNQFIAKLNAMNPEDLQAMKQSWEERSQMIGKKIRFGKLEEKKLMQEAHVLGLASDGSLRVHVNGREAQISSDDVSVRD